ncbi:MAG: substrate-binding domain-containing protein, partial [Rhizobiaceae bacterium]|nr:substrate-binding domain-containing protein [Rhizobiaceae bacterium]
IAFVAGAENSSTNRDRETGFTGELSAIGKPLWRRTVGGYTFHGAAQAARELLSGPVWPDAIFVANDHMAFSAMDVLRDEFGLRIPDDVSLVGYDDVPEAGWGGYKLTTIRQPGDEMIAETVRILVEQIETRKVVKYNAVLPGNLVVRSSARLPDADTLSRIQAELFPAAT